MILFFKISLENKKKKIFGPKWISVLESEKIVDLLKFVSPFFLKQHYLICFSFNQVGLKLRCFPEFQLKKLSEKKHFRIVFITAVNFEKPIKFNFNENYVYSDANEYFSRSPFHLLFKRLYQNKKKKKVFYIIDPIFHGKDLLWNDIIDIFWYDSIFELDKGFLNRNNFFFSISTDSLWFLDSQYEKFWKRRIHGNKVNLPPLLFVKLFGHKIYKLLFQNESGIININSKKKTLKECSLREFSHLIRAIITDLKFFFEKHLIFPQFVYSLKNLAISFASYADYNKNSQKRTKKNHLRTNIRNFEKYMILKTIEPGKIKASKIYMHYKFFLTLLRSLENIKEYEPIDLFPLLPLDKLQRAKILGTIRLPFPFQILQYSPGGNKRKVVICWKIPFYKEYRNESKTDSIISKEKIKFPIFLSRTMLTTKIFML